MNNKITISKDLVVLDESVQLTTHGIAQLFEVSVISITKNIESIFKSGVVRGDYSRGATQRGKTLYPDYYGVEMIAALAFRIHSPKTAILRKYLIKQLSKPQVKAEFMDFRRTSDIS